MNSGLLKLMILSKFSLIILFSCSKGAEKIDNKLEENKIDIHCRIKLDTMDISRVLFFLSKVNPGQVKVNFDKYKIYQSSYDLGSRILELVISDHNSRRYYNYSRIVKYDKLVTDRLEIYERGTINTLYDTIRSTSYYRDTFLIDYNDIFQTSYDSMTFINEFYSDRSGRLRIFGGHGGNVFSKEIESIFLNKNVDETMSLLKSPNLTERFKGYMIFKYLIDSGFEVPTKGRDIFDYLTRTNIKVDIHMQCVDQKMPFRNYLNFKADSVMFDYFSDTTKRYDFRFIK